MFSTGVEHNTYLVWLLGMINTMGRYHTPRFDAMMQKLFQMIAPFSVI